MDTVHIVDDDEGVRDSLRILLESAGFAARPYASAAALLSAGQGISGCVLTDVRMPGMDGLELQEQLNSRGLRLPVIVMTGQADIPVAVQAMKAGAVDFLEKPFSDTQLLEAVQRAMIECQRREQQAVAAADAAARLQKLTPREREVLDLLVNGLSSKEIANVLGGSPRTIEVHRARVHEKLGARSLPELVRLVLRASPEG